MKIPDVLEKKELDLLGIIIPEQLLDLRIFVIVPNPYGLVQCVARKKLTESTFEIMTKYEGNKVLNYKFLISEIERMLLDMINTRSFIDCVK